MMRATIPGLFFGLTLTISGNAVATGSSSIQNIGQPIDLAVNMATNCIGDVQGNGGQVATGPVIGPGLFKASFKSSSAEYCGDCRADQIGLYTPSHSPHGWMHVVNKGRPKFFSLPGPTPVFGFFVDDICNDNSGTAILTIQQIKSFPSVCSGSDCD